MSSPKRSGTPDYDRSVFINCPFDPPFQPIFQAIVFSIEDCGFLTRCALEVEDSADLRANKIIRIIKSCALGIHDISRTELNAEGLPRFNMPYELGLFIGCKEFGSGKHKNKSALILDREPHRYAKYISDIAGQDIQFHGNDVPLVIKRVRNWLASNSRGNYIPGSDMILNRSKHLYQTSTRRGRPRQLSGLS
jgi:hypothetical protein